MQARADLWFSMLLIAVGTVIVVESWRMPRLDNLGVHPMSAPGLTPGLLGLVLTILGLLLLTRSIRARLQAPPPGTGESGGRLRFIVTLCLCLGYAIVLLGRVPFWLATAVFVFAFVVVFTWRQQSLVKTGWRAAALALSVAVVVTLLFEKVFLVRLP